MNSDEVREAFLNYFESKGHLRMPSSSLIPIGDSTLLLTNAGMVQFKQYFAGETQPPSKRLTSCQKSFRTVDINEVGDPTHLTLFEMLGNFSIGDYFKAGAMEFALEFLVGTLGLPKTQLYATVYKDDTESETLWAEMGIPANRIYRFGKEDNWWGPAGQEGPCGPCTELHYDFGQSKGCHQDDCAPNCHHVMNDEGDLCNRFVELWNVVFMQLYQHIDGNLTPLPSPSVDTGLGLERIVVVTQGVDTIYETDIFLPLIRYVEEYTGKSYGVDRNTDYDMRVVVEHVRGSVFLIADGVVPGNEGRGYVLRRLIRRAIRHSRNLGVKDGFLGDLANLVISRMGLVYPELRNHQDFILTVLKLEEERFQQVFSKGYTMLTDALKGSKVLSGDVAFKLWDTYGFPVEMTQEIANEISVDVDLVGFNDSLDKQRQRARKSARFDGDRTAVRIYNSLGVGSTKFLGYDEITASSVIIGLISNGQPVNEINNTENAEVILLETPFYAEGGGQVGDVGELIGPNGKIEINDTQMAIPGLIVHRGKVICGSVSMGDTVNAYVDRKIRENIARNHTATHLLHASLREILGSHVRQTGSLVASDRLRFDFSHVKSVTSDELRQIQWLVSEKIRENVRVVKSEDSYDSGIKRGALAFFGDKYENNVRLVEIDDANRFSFEVCGGTHVERTGEIGAIHILNESSIGAGVRRIEAVTGRYAEILVWERFKLEDRLASKFQTPLSDLEDRVTKLLDEFDQLKRSNENLERRLSLHAAESLLEFSRTVCGVTVLATRTSVANTESLRDIGDWIRDKLGSGVVVLGSVIDNRPIIISMVTSDLVNKGIDATEIAKNMSKIIDGGGGGRPDVAQAGGRSVDKLDEALKLVTVLIQEKMANL